MSKQTVQEARRLRPTVERSRGAEAAPREKSDERPQGQRAPHARWRRDDPAETSRPKDYVDAIYVPSNLRDQRDLELTCRSPTGNRSNKVSINTPQGEVEQAIQRRVRRIMATWRYEQARPRSSSLRTALAGAAVLILVLVFATSGATKKSPLSDQALAPTSYSMTSTTVPESTPVRVPPSVRIDDAGSPLEIRASDPETVLLEYCKAKKGEFCEPIELAHSQPRHAGLRFGIFRGSIDIRAIEIRRDPTTQKWFAGDGKRPVVDFMPGTRLMSSDRVPVSDSDAGGRGDRIASLR